MGMDPDARLAYGYDLGTMETFRATPRTEYDSPDLPWLDEDNSDLAEQAKEVLLASVGFTETWERGADGFYERQREAEARLGVEFTFAGSHDYPGFILAATGSAKSVEWTETMALDPAELSLPRPQWDAKLAAALAALGVVPDQGGPRWLVFPFYG